MNHLNLFFKKRKKIYFHKVLENLNIKNKKNYKNFLVNDIQTIDQAKKNDISEDEHKASQEDVQKETDHFIKDLEDLLKQKEQEIMTV